MCLQVNFKPSHRCIERGIGVFGEDKGFHSTPLLILRRHSEQFFVFGIILTHMLFAKGGESSLMALMTPFLAIYAKGGESMSPKQKDRTTT
jgi:hypothetical protein